MVGEVGTRNLLVCLFQIRIHSSLKEVGISKILGPWDFSGSPVVKTLCFQCRGHRFNPWLGN